MRRHAPRLRPSLDDNLGLREELDRMMVVRVEITEESVPPSSEGSGIIDVAVRAETDLGDHFTACGAPQLRRLITGRRMPLPSRVVLYFMNELAHRTPFD